MLLDVPLLWNPRSNMSSSTLPLEQSLNDICVHSVACGTWQVFITTAYSQIGSHLRSLLTFRPRQMVQMKASQIDKGILKI